MREKFKTILSEDYNDVRLVEQMLNDGYKLITIVTPNNYPYKSTVGYVYWFKSIYDEKDDEYYSQSNPYED